MSGRGMVCGCLGLLTLTAGLAAGPSVQAASRIERELSLGTSGELVLDAEGSTVNVVGGSRANARIVITGKDEIEASFDVRFQEDPARATVTIEHKGGANRWFGWFRSRGLRVDVEVPRGAAVRVDTSGGTITVEDVSGELRLETSGGAISGVDVGGDVHASTSGGSIEFERVGGAMIAETSGGAIRVTDAAGSVDAETSGGSIQIQGAGGDVRAETSGGGIRVAGARGRVDAETSGGPVEVEFAPGNAAGGSLSSSGGGVRATVDPGVGLEIDASASGGSVSIDIPITVQGEISKSRLHGTIGGGGALLRLRSSGGGVRIGAGDAAGR